MKAGFYLLLAIELLGCSGDATSPITFGAFGPLSGDAGRGSFRFGVATAATQIEDDNPHTDWYLWTQPVASGGLGKGTFVGDAARGYAKASEDLGLVAQLGVDSYRFSIEWARIEPTRDAIDDADPQTLRITLVGNGYRGPVEFREADGERLIVGTCPISQEGKPHRLA